MKWISVISGNLWHTNGGNVSRVEHTCVVEHNRPLAGWAGDVSYMSFNPNVNWPILDKRLFHDLMRSFLEAPKFFMTVWWTQATLWETESIFLQAWHCADFADLMVWYYIYILKHLLNKKVVFHTALSCIQAPFTKVNRVIRFSSKALGTRWSLTCWPLEKTKQKHQNVPTILTLKVFSQKSVVPFTDDTKLTVVRGIFV